jgi:hypothetical protein
MNDAQAMIAAVKAGDETKVDSLLQENPALANAKDDAPSPKCCARTMWR